MYFVSAAFPRIVGLFLSGAVNLAAALVLIALPDTVIFISANIARDFKDIELNAGITSPVIKRYSRVGIGASLG